ncbi:DUF427 domain-containing protein [Halomonas sp. TBZ9]|uniref:DUF427 domain-containing protein n=1 Tax=Vreelandella azerica TaxID=2732867 RepID=A0A7Y3TWP5_9GAMM|nr:DUF427 domain-containing protein [Halomonas azerica]NOG31434.1 DUF427 domain-containing protein [Halomonas azerica]
MPQDARINLHPSRQHLQVHANGMLLADSANTIELRVLGYPPRHYFPCEDVLMGLDSSVANHHLLTIKEAHNDFFSLSETQELLIGASIRLRMCGRLLVN